MNLPMLTALRVVFGVRELVLCLYFCKLMCLSIAADVFFCLQNNLCDGSK